MKNSNGENGVQCADLEDLSDGSLTAGETLTADCDSLNNDAMVYLADRDGDNDDTNEGGLNSKEDVIDAVCWNDGSGTHLACDDTSDPIVAAGLWEENNNVNNAYNQGILLTTSGNNDDGASDWEAIPEFGTFLMPIASVLLIVGYNYRRKKTEN